MKKVCKLVSLVVVLYAFSLVAVSAEDIPSLTTKEQGFVEDLWRKKEPKLTQNEKESRLKQLARGKWAVKESCAGCHGLEKLRQGTSSWTEDSWRGDIKRMQLQGAPVPEEDINVMASYLAIFLGEDSTDEIRTETLK